MDYSHIMKIIRNICCESGLRSTHKRKFTYSLGSLSEAFNREVSENSYSIHRKLTHEHFFLTPESKKRNHLAEDVLDKEMLHLMNC